MVKTRILLVYLDSCCQGSYPQPLGLESSTLPLSHCDTLLVFLLKDADDKHMQNYQACKELNALITITELDLEVVVTIHRVILVWPMLFSLIFADV